MLLDAEDDAFFKCIKTSLEDVKAGRVSHFKHVDDLLKKIEEE